MKPKILGVIRVNAYEIVCRAVEEGIGYGYRRAYKHTATPDENALKEEIYCAVMNELCEVLWFTDDAESTTEV